MYMPTGTEMYTAVITMAPGSSVTMGNGPTDLQTEIRAWIGTTLHVRAVTPEQVLIRVPEAGHVVLVAVVVGGDNLLRSFYNDFGQGYQPFVFVITFFKLGRRSG
jgi:hypothetical protein